MRITVDHSLTGSGDVDLDVTRGTALSEIVAECASRVVWCGTRRLDPTHPAGTVPLVSGAVLSALPARDRVDPASLHLAAVSGPDAGVIVSIDSPTALGSASPAAIVRDAACDAHHATLTPTPRGGLRVRDEGSVNGTGVWVLRAGELRWRGRRRRASLRSGDAIAVGRTLLEVRGGDPASEPARRRRPRLAGPLLASAATAFRTVAQGLQTSRSLTLDLGAWPDPTRVGAGNADWAAPVAIRGPHAEEVARAVILARGRRPPTPCPLDEPWLSWLPDPLPSDGPIRIERSEQATRVEGWVILTADADGMTLNRQGVPTRGSAVRVLEDTADALARSLAGSLPEPPPRVIGWAHAASLAGSLSGPPADGLAWAGWKKPSDRAVVAGVHVDNPATPWRLEMGSSSRLTLISGASGSGKTTLMATIAGALAVSSSPNELRIVILCASDPGPLEPYLRLPHVTAFATHAEPPEALTFLADLDARDAFTVVIADDLDRLGPNGRAVAARLESLALEGDGSVMHVIMATAQPAAVFTPSLRAAKGTAVALRAARPADSVEVVGVEAAARLPLDSPGRALVRSSGRIDTVHVALPWADAPRVRPWGAPVPGVRSLAEAACTGLGTTAPTPPWSGPARPVS